MGSWEPEQVPWVRAEAIAHPDSEGYATCYFCGERSVVKSYGDNRTDSGRVDVYCRNEDCDARETTVIVLRDGYSASARADVRALRAVDSESASAEEPPMVVKSFGERLADRDDPAVIAHRRQNTAPINFAIWGHDQPRKVPNADET